MHVGYEVFHDDIDGLVDFYVRVLGFTAVDFDEGFDHVIVRRDDVYVGCTRVTDAIPPQRRPPLGSEIVLGVDDLAAEYQRVVDSGWPIADDLQRRSWGLYDFRVFDPSGQYIRITTDRVDAV